MSEDARYATKYYLEYYDTPANITKDDDATFASYIYQFEKPPYPIKRVFFNPKNVDGIYTIYTPNSEALLDSREYTYGYIETVPIEISTVTKHGMNGDKLRWKMEKELRRIVETYPLGSRRSLSHAAPQDRDMGTWKQHTIRYDLRYKRISEDYAPTTPTFSSSIAFTSELDALTGGVEGTWTLTLGGGTPVETQAISTGNNLVLTISDFVGDCYTTSGTSLGLNSSTWGRIRVRYKTTGAAKAKIVVKGSSGNQTILAETASPQNPSAFTVIDVVLIPATVGNINTFELYACDGVGTVTYDYLQIYAENYILPITTRIEGPFKAKDVIINIPGMSGDYTQSFGTELLAYTTVHDLDLEPDELTWKRPQTTTPKSDANPDTVFIELEHQSGIQVLWTWLDLGVPARQFKARLANREINYMGNLTEMRLTWMEYRHGSASGESVVERFGEDL